MSLGLFLAPAPGGGWQPGIGDPTLAGWLTVVAYLLGGAACIRTSQVKTRPEREGARAAGFWLALGLLLLAGGVNKQLDLQSLLTEIGRSMATQGGWYGERRVAQAAFIGSVAAIGLGALITLSWLNKGRGGAERVALVGAVLLATFVLVRASSFHKVDRLIGIRLGGLTTNVVLELGGIGCVALAALSELMRSRHRSGPTGG